MDQQIAAILVGLARHVEESEREMAESVPADPSDSRGTSPWALRGRTAAMQMRSLMQQGLLHR